MSAGGEAALVLDDQPSRDALQKPNSEQSNTNSTNHDGGRNAQSQPERRPMKRSSQNCRYFNTKSGCRAGASCRFHHVQPASFESERASDLTHALSALPSDVSGGDKAATKDKSSIRKSVRQTGRTMVAKPIPQAQKTNPREFQIGQVERRFKPQCENLTNGTTVLSLSIQPSDPDFPFELQALKCKLSIPADWPAASSGLSLRIENTEIPRGYQINIERGFGELISTKKTLLALLNELDRNLERFLSSEKAQTIKIVANRPRSEAQQQAETAKDVPPTKITTLPSAPSWTTEERAQAKLKRDADIRQLEARMGRMPLFSASKDKCTFNIPLQYVKPSKLPLSLQALKEVSLHVPLQYNLEPCTMKLKGVTGSEADNVELAFLKYSSTNLGSTLMAQINYLTVHLPEMAQKLEMDLAQSIAAIPEHPENVDAHQFDGHSLPETTTAPADAVIDEDRPHLVFLSRPPPEWMPRSQSGNEEDSDSEESDFTNSDTHGESSADEGQEGGAAISKPTTTTTPASFVNGVLFSLPYIEMTGIELLEVNSLSISVKCERCKTQIDLKNIKPTGTDATTHITRAEHCPKCTNPLTISYQAEPIHTNSIKAGTLNLQGCTIHDLLPSTFLPTCSECSTTQSPPGTTAVRGDTSLSICHECHRKQTFKITETKFLRVTTADDPRLKGPLPPRRKKKENLGITAGTELPSRGRCKHYTKSYRWFRFSCCNRVYACDRCHDEAETHVNEHANRMICGWCSREQNYRPEDCSSCKRSVIRKVRGGFWEGGKGTRDRVKMNRNDPRKYKRIGGGSTSTSTSTNTTTGNNEKKKK